MNQKNLENETPLYDIESLRLMFTGEKVNSKTSITPETDAAWRARFPVARGSGIGYSLALEIAMKLALGIWAGLDPRRAAVMLADAVGDDKTAIFAMVNNTEEFLNKLQELMY